MIVTTSVRLSERRPSSPIISLISSTIALTSLLFKAPRPRETGSILISLRILSTRSSWRIISKRQSTMSSAFSPLSKRSRALIRNLSFLGSSLFAVWLARTVEARSLTVPLSPSLPKPSVSLNIVDGSSEISSSRKVSRISETFATVAS